MNVKDTLIDIEKRFWEGTDEFYEENLAEDPVMIFPKPTGVLNKSEVMESVSGEQRWKNIEFSDVQINKASDSAVQLVYEATAESTQDGSEFKTLASSLYVKKNGSWKLVSHQQTPE